MNFEVGDIVTDGDGFYLIIYHDGGDGYPYQLLDLDDCKTKDSAIELRDFKQFYIVFRKKDEYKIIG